MISYFLQISAVLVLWMTAFWGSILLHVLIQDAIEGNTRWRDAVFIPLLIVLFAPGYVFLSFEALQTGFALLSVGGAVAIQLGISVMTVVTSIKDEWAL